MERIGVSAVDTAFSALGWALREQDVADQGIDALVEVDGLRSAPTGRYLAVQIKCGPSFFRRRTEHGWRFPGKPRHLGYWLSNQLPVILVIVDADQQTCYWVQITHDAVHYTDSGWWIEVPEAQALDTRSIPLLREIALASPPAAPDPVEQAVPLLPPSVAELLATLRIVDRNGALRLARFLTEGRHQPRATVAALLDASRVWPHAGDLDTAITLLRSRPSPAAAELLAEVLHDAGRFDDALAVCNQAWQTYGTLKALQDKVNILASRGDLDAAEACAAQLLATGELAVEQRRQLHSRMIERRLMLADWAGVEAYCRAALGDQPGDHDHAWG